ncbi:MAG TPA: family 78 glycoside hydrolase catalytic domain [Verrucomicrobiae bacterium]|nr:family 78 glycoside hydrolase catalytic domain [Verrucomicrobiae bacterium]
MSFSISRKQYGSFRSFISSRVFAALILFCAGGFAFSSAFAADVTDLRCENLQNPLGIDALHPRFSWKMKLNGFDQKQTAYEILVATTPRNLRPDRADLWDSGKINSDQSIQVFYDGKTLESGEDCFWKVRVWDADGKPSGWSEPARFSMGLLRDSDWHAQWIGLDAETKTNWLSGTSWIWFPEGEPAKSAPVGQRYFRRTFALPSDREVMRARVLLTGDNDCQGYINGHDVGSRNNYHITRETDVTTLLHPGKNVFALLGSNTGEGPGPAGVIARLEIRFNHGAPMVITTDEQWRTRDREMPGWTNTDFDDGAWTTAKKLGPAGMDPWKNIVAPESRRLPARWLRKDFTVKKRIRRAMVYYSGLGDSELYLNGGKVGDAVLSPAVSEYEKRVFYVTADVTKQLKRGANALGVVLGNGRFYSPRSRLYAGMSSYGSPKLLLQLHIEFTDGSSSEIVSDMSWKLTTNGPIVANNEYDGEEYDARKEFDNWSRAGFDDSKWQNAKPVSAPEGKLVAQMIEPIRVTQTLKPIAVTEPKPGVFIFDLGQNMVGWCRLKISGPSGTRVTLRHAETLKPDGTLYIANLRGAQATDIYTLRGDGVETWEPRFIYHGFRYVEITGWPGKPTLDSIEGRVVHDDLDSVGNFACSNPLINQIYHNIVWGTRGNYRSIPTDCPQRDERQGWMGDRSEETKGESYIFDTQAFHEKWLQDMADAQKENGSVPDVAPSFWPIYRDDVTWPSTTIILPGTLYEQFGDTAIVKRHYDSAKKWMDYMLQYVHDGIISRDSYGDWCVPPEDPKLIHSRDPKRQTNHALLATAYFYHDARLMENYAKLSGKSDDAQHFNELAEQLKTAFNKRFLNRELGQYDNGTQTSCVLPLAFGLVPDDMREKVFACLVNNIQNVTHGHIGTGLIGGQYLMRVLTENGRADLAYEIASQKDYPGWGYMVEKGATTIWELWNGDTADPSMNSGNHVMLVGDLAIWLYENIAGIKSDPAQPGFKHIIMKPEPTGDLIYAKATHRSPYGLIASDWRKNGNQFDWQIEIPPNTTATVYVPASGLSDVSLDSRAAKIGVKPDRFENGRAIFELGGGKYHFTSH